MRSNQDFLLYPLATADLPVCPGCGYPLAIAVHEVRENLPDFSTYICDECDRSERFVCEQ
jgi:hypothetical protein